MAFRQPEKSQRETSILSAPDARLPLNAVCDIVCL
jgi:hypothetical protein